MRFVTGVTVVHPQGGPQGGPGRKAARKSEIRIARGPKEIRNPTSLR
jgi:hypothetical protein